MHHPFACSKQVCATQFVTEAQLRDRVRRHSVTGFRKPYQAHNLRAFYQLRALCQDKCYTHKILDSGCGTAMSTAWLALQHPDALVVGVDQSASRLRRANAQQLPGNAYLIRANCEDVWRLCIEHNLIFDDHKLLYPNPWPKYKHYKRRWHGHAVFPYLVGLSRRLELRTNWRPYLSEFNLAWHQLTGQMGQIEQLHPHLPITRFEKKYHESGHPLYRLRLINPDI